MSKTKLFAAKNLLFVLSLFVICEGISGSEENEYYSSVSGLENLLKTEVVMLAELQDYVDTLSDHIEALQSEMEVIKVEHLTASTDLEGYLSNPVNSYRLIKRLHNDWPTYEESVNGDTSRTNYLGAVATLRQNYSFPTLDDVVGSAVALVRLQETYKLDVAELASGILNGVKYGSSMSWQDCFYMGHYLYKLRDFNHTISWLKQSSKMLIDQNYNNDPLSLDFIEEIAAYHQEMGDFETALHLNNHVLSVDPERQSIHDTKVYLEQMITDGIKQGLLHETVLPSGGYWQTNEYKLYQRVCRGEVARTPAEQRALSCKYHTNNVPYRLLQPFKMEELNLDPLILQFHDVISDKQIRVVKRLAKPRMSRSMVRSPDGGNATVSTFRTSKSAWMEYTEHRYMNGMRLHLQDFSGLNARYTEDLQVANYGIGGHYEPHWDFFVEDLSFDDIDGNRVATGIYYLSDVEEGGATVFPFLHVLVKPKKGSVLFWYNLHSSDEPDYRTKHAACPVLKGSKWIANIWVRVRNQDRERPCGLRPDHEISLMYKDYD